MKYFIAFSLTLLFAISLQAQNEEFNPCEAEQNQMNMNACAKQRFDEADRDLNVAYRKLMRMVSGDFEEKIRATQRVWIKYRDQNCECARSIYDGGSIAPMILLNCKQRMTEQRTAELTDLIEQLDM